MAVDISALLGMNPATVEEPDYEYGEGTIEVLDSKVSAIDKLGDPETHEHVKNKLLRLLDSSERKMSQFHARWNLNEMKVQAYISLPDYEKALKEARDAKGMPPIASAIVVPFAYAAHSTAVTFLVHTFAGRRPMFPIGTYKDEGVEHSRNMEEMIQYQADHTRLVKKLWQFFNDIVLYGVGAVWNEWCVLEKMRTVRSATNITSQLGVTGSQFSRERKMMTVYEGNEVSNIDPFLFHPDPRVPMSEVNKNGEFVFYRSFSSKLALKKLENQGYVKFVDKIRPGTTEMNKHGTPFSYRSLISGGDPIPGTEGLSTPGSPEMIEYFVQLDQGSVELIPKEWKLSDSETPEKWFFILGNKHQIIAAERIDDDHDMHRVSVSEPIGFGYGFGQPAMIDFVNPIQDLISWFVNSHVENVRLALNNMLIVDPAMVEMQDLKRPGPGKYIRLKQAARGQDVRTVIQQLQIYDVTAAHPQNVELMMTLGQLLLGFNENIMGVPQSGGRKTATEVRIAGEAAISRLSLLARIISAQGITDLTEQMVLNTQQYLSDSFSAMVLGRNGQKLLLTPEHVVGDFTFPAYDGVLPPDRMALFQAWKEGTEAIAQDQELRGIFDLPKMVEHTMELAGARNIEEFRRPQAPAPPAGSPIVPDEEAARGAEAGNLIPLDVAMRGLQNAA